MAKKKVKNGLELFGEVVALEKTIDQDLPDALFTSTENGKLECYIGYKPLSTAGDDFSYHVSVGRKKGEDAEEGRFIQLASGALQWGYSPFNSLFAHYYIPSLHLFLPRKTNPRFSIQKSGEDCDELTRQFFGLTFDELTSLVSSYETASGHQRCGPARVTCSLKYNTCDLTGALIPREFPYITFTNSDFIWSHISLSGFYSHIAFLLMNGPQSEFYLRLLDEGCSAETLNNVRKLVLNYKAIVGKELAC